MCAVILNPCLVCIEILFGRHFGSFYPLLRAVLQSLLNKISLVKAGHIPYIRNQVKVVLNKFIDSLQIKVFITYYNSSLSHVMQISYRIRRFACPHHGFFKLLQATHIIMLEIKYL